LPGSKKFFLGNHITHKISGNKGHRLVPWKERQTSRELSFWKRVEILAHLCLIRSTSSLRRIRSDIFRQAAASEEAWKATVLSGKAIVLSAYELLTHPEKVNAVKEKFKELKEQERK